MPSYRSKKQRRGSLSGPVRRALVLLLRQGALTECGPRWWAPPADRHKVGYQVIEAMFARHLICILVDSRHRGRHTAKLTEIGLHVARDLARNDAGNRPDFAAPGLISEAASQLVSALIWLLPPALALPVIVNFWLPLGALP